MTEATLGLPVEKQTTLALYVTAEEAYAKWLADPGSVKIIDVRTPEEFLFVGHPEMAWKIPAFAQSYEWDAVSGKFPMTLLPDFVARVQTVAKNNETILVTCRSGGRAAVACNLLAQAGFKHVYNVVDGIEGDGNGSSACVPLGGWKHSGCPWTKVLTPERMVLPKVA